MKRKKLIIGSLFGTTILLTIWMYGENRKLKGVVKNQENTITGLLREIKKVSYHLGKKS